MKNYHPSDFVHCILAAFVSDDQTGKIAGGCPLKKNSQVKFVEEDQFYIYMRDEIKIDMNHQIKDWTILQIFDDEQTGYLSILFENTKDKQLVLSHRSTNFNCSLTTKNLLQQSGLQCDVVSVVMGGISVHQAQAFYSTQEAVELAKQMNFQLSFSGHSLGAWLAEMSVYYCHVVFDYPNVKAVTIDGPGSYEMMEQLSKNEIRGQQKFIESELDIVAYLSAPNLVNCCNTHIGTIYRLFPDLQFEKNNKSWFDKLLNILSKMNGEKSGINALLATVGHDLKFILPYFNPKTGTPNDSEISKMQRWPKIGHTKEKNNKQNSKLQLVKDLSQLIGSYFIIPQIINTTISAYKYFTKGLDILLDSQNIFIQQIFNNNNEPNTIYSIAIIFKEFFNGGINLDQLWQIHPYLSKQNQFKISVDKSKQFEIFVNGYCEVQIDRKKRKITDKIDKHLKLIKDKEGIIHQVNACIEFKSKIKNICQLYNYQYGVSDEFLIQENNIDLEEIRGYIKFILRDYQQDFINLMNYRHQNEINTKIVCRLNKLQSSQNNEVIRKQQISIIDNYFKSSKVVIIKGGPGFGKRTFASQFAMELKQKTGIKVWPFNAQNINSLKSDYSYYLETVLDINVKEKSEEEIKLILNDKISQYSLQILFIFDHVQKDIDEIKTYINCLPNNVQLLITTRQQIKGWTQYDLEMFTKEEASYYLLKNIERNVDQDFINQILKQDNLIPIKLSKIVSLINHDNMRYVTLPQVLQEVKANENKIISGYLLQIFDDQTKYILNILSWLNPNLIQLEFLSYFENDKTELIKSLEILRQNSIIYLLDDCNIKIHRVYQDEIFSTQLNSKYAEEIASILISILPTLSPDNYTNNNFSIVQKYHRYGRYLYDLIKERNITIKLNIEINLLYKLANIYNFCLHFKYEAKQLYLNAVYLVQKSLEQLFKENIYYEDENINLILVDIHMEFLNLILLDFRQEIDDNLIYLTFLVEQLLEIPLLSRIIQDSGRLGDIYYLQASFSLEKKDYNKFFQEIDQAGKQYEMQKKYIGIYKIKKLNGLYHYSIQQYQTAQQYFYQCLEIADEHLSGLQKIESKCDIFNYLSLVIDSLNGKINCLHLAMEEYEKGFNTKISKNYARYCINLAENYQKINDNSQSQIFYQEAAEIFRQIYSGENQEIMADIYFYIGLNKMEQKNPKFEFLKDFDKSLEIAIIIKNQKQIVRALEKIAEIKADIGDLKQSIKLIEEIISIKIKSKQYYDSETITNLLTLSNLYEKFCKDQEKQLELYKLMVVLSFYCFELITKNQHKNIRFSGKLQIQQKFPLYNWSITNQKNLPILEKLKEQKFFQSNRKRQFIKRIGNSSLTLLQIKKQLYANTLKFCVKYAQEDKWQGDVIGLVLWGIKDIIELQYIKKQLGDLFRSQDDIEIAYMLLFEALNLGISQNNFLNIGLSRKFIDTIDNGDKIITRVIDEHPEYFIDGQILKLFVQDPIKLEQLIDQKEVEINFSTFQLIQNFYEMKKSIKK